MRYERLTSWLVVRAPVLLMTLTAGTPALAQGPALPWAVPSVPSYVSMSGATAFGFFPYPEPRPSPSVDLVAMLAPDSDIPPVYRPLLGDMWRGSATFRRQWIRIADSRVRITIIFDPKCVVDGAHAQSEISRKRGLRVRVSLRNTDRSAIEHLAHELEHVLEQLDDVDLPEAVKNHVHGASALGEPALFETRRASVIGKLVAREVNASQDRR
jgi:hypothetical protein